MHYNTHDALSAGSLRAALYWADGKGSGSVMRIAPCLLQKELDEGEDDERADDLRGVADVEDEIGHGEDSADAAEEAGGGTLVVPD